MGTIRLVKRKDINQKKWDELIDLSVNSLPYALTWYLDAVAENWDAFVLGDYAAVMPLVWLRKIGIKCIYQPYYCQQLGIFSTEPVRKKQAAEFIQLVKQGFSYINTNLSPTVQPVAAEFNFSHKTNLILHLDKGIEALRKKYAENQRRNIQKAVKNDWQFTEQTDLKSFQQFYLKNVDRKKEDFKKKHEKIFLSLTNELMERNKGKIFTVISKDGKIAAAAMLILHQKRMINIVNSSSEQGKKEGAAHFLFDGIITKYALSDNVLDFEGSSVPGIARFYKGFGAVEEAFYNYKSSVFKL